MHLLLPSHNFVLICLICSMFLFFPFLDSFALISWTFFYSPLWFSWIYKIHPWLIMSSISQYFCNFKENARILKIIISTYSSPVFWNIVILYVFHASHDIMFHTADTKHLMCSTCLLLLMFFIPLCIPWFQFGIFFP